ncbi:MAG: TonB-dependent receptor [Verrucomicrobiota bacterium]
MQRAQRHPTSTELFANGPHLATSQFEIGDPDLDIETAYGVDLTYRTAIANWSAEASVFYTYFEDYIYAENQGFETDELDTYQFVAIDAEFFGFEAAAATELYRSKDTAVSLRLMADWVNGSNEDTGDDLPRIPPMHIGSRISVEQGPWQGGLELRYAFKQDDIAEYETETDAYTEFNADISYRFDLGNGMAAVLFARAENLLDEEIRKHTSFIKDESPLPGRNFTLGGRFEF